MLYHTGDSRRTQNFQINEVIGENEHCVVYFTEKTKWTFWPAHVNAEIYVAVYRRMGGERQASQGAGLHCCGG